MPKKQKSDKKVTRSKWLLFWAWVYRCTGWYSPFAEIAEYRALWKEIDRIWKSHKGKRACKVSCEFLSIYIGTWQAVMGFTRPYRGLRGEKKKV